MKSFALKKNLIALSLLSTLYLTACTSSVTNGPLHDVSTPQLNTREIKNTSQTQATLSSWNITGAIAAKKNKKAWSASLTWQQFNKNDYEMHLFGPLGGGSILLKKKNSLLTYQDGHKTIQSTNETELLYKETGVILPVRQLFYWVRGINAPGAIQSSEHDNEGHLTQLCQSGYTISYSDYTTVQHISLPTKIRLENANSIVKLVIKRWDINA